MQGSSNNDNRHDSPGNPSTPSIRAPGVKSLKEAERPRDKSLPQTAPQVEDVSPTTSRQSSPRLEERPQKRTSQTSLVLGRGILKSSAQFQPRNATSQRPDTTDAGVHGSSMGAPTMPGAVVRPDITDSARKRHTSEDAPTSEKPLSSETSASQKSSISALKDDLHFPDQWVTITDDMASEKSEERQKLPFSPASTAGEQRPEGLAVIVLPVSKGKRVSIDPNPTIDTLTPESSSPTPSMERDMMKALPMTRHSAVMDASSNQLGRRKPGHWQLLVFAVGIIVVSLMAALVSLMVIGRSHVPIVAQVSVCDTKDCIDYAQNLSRRMNTSADPCHEFHAYVCGHGDADDGSQSRRSIRRTRQQAEEIVRALNQPNYMLFSKHPSMAAYKALSAMDTCMARERDHSPELFASFMKDRGLPWPEPPGKVLNLAGVLDILFDLAVNWRVALWFDVRVSHLGADGALVMTLEEPGPVPLFRMEQLSDLDELEYGDAVNTVVHFLTESKTTLEKDAIYKLYRDESAIRDVVLSSDEDHDAWVLPNGTDHGFNVSSDEWARLVDKYVAASGFSTPEPVGILAIHKAQFHALARLLSKLPVDSLLAAVGWTVAYSYAWTVNQSLDIFTPDANRAAGPTYEVSVALCFLAVFETHGITMMAPMFLEEFSSVQRSRVTTVLNKTVEALVSAVGISTTIRIETKKNASVKIAAHAYRNFWPPEPFLHIEMLDLLYEKFPMESGSFFATWMGSRKALRASITNRYYATLMLARYRWRSSRVLYIYALNLMLVGLAAVFPPSYLREGSHTMTYAGLGFQFARQLVRTVDHRGRGLDFAGRPSGSSRLNQTRPKCRLSTAKTSTERREIGDLFALDISMAAMKQADSTDSAPLQLKSLEHLSPEQTFYISYCDQFCDKQPQQLAKSMCNLAVNGSDFANAFGCDARIRDTPECVFF
ncbi:hypothetical protein HPB50_006852 [Hyalomma asiaticum]|uniref:Uncharacterized protein n=1 Tax=Hyalomma asiaticum TaxID=266040 RepID=A0ACB7T4V8_HYAAI|nr:hypothetical protein HPB50_006852 [Hyalomma asiaticum]